MAGYLGKISAVVSVNTGDFAQKLAQCAKNVSAFANSTEQSLANSARASQRSFGTIYSEVQKLERQLQAAARLNLSGIAKIDASSLSEAADKMRTIHSIASQLSTPLGQAVKELESMSMRVRKTLHDSMVRAQTSVQGLQTAAETTGRVTSSSFRAAARDVDRFTDSLKYAKSAMAEADRMGGSKGFRFQNPALYDQMRRGGSLYEDASRLPADQITPELTSLLARQQGAAAAAARFASAAEQSPNAINTTGLRGAMRGLESVNDEIQRVLSGYAQIESSEKERIARASRLLGLEQQFNQAITGQSQSIDQLKSRYAALAGAAERLPAANRAAAGAAMAGDVSMAQGVISSEDTTQLVAADQALARAEAVVAAEANKVRVAEEGAAQAKRDAADAAALLAKQSATLASLEARRLQIATGEVQTVAQLDAKYASLMSRLDRLPPQYRAIAAAAVAADAAMVETAIATGGDSDVAAVRGELAGIEGVVAGYESLNASAEQAKKEATALQERLSRIADSIGDPAKPIDQLAAAVAAANAEIAKMPTGAAKASAEAVMRGLKPQIESATTDAEIGMLTGVARGVGSQAKGINNAPKVKTADDVFGPAVGSRASQIDQLQSRIKTLHGEIEKLPLPLQVSMRPELEKIRNLFMNLGPSSTAKEIQDATLKAKLFGDEVARQSQANKFGGSFANFLDDTAAKKYEAELSAVQARMAAVGATAGGPVATAINKYRAALEQAAKAGTLGSDAVRDNMKALLSDIEKAVVAEGKLTEAQAKAVFGGIKGAGDVGRMGADKAGLALNQLAFAVDDFMSASGGIEMKIRAISNNLTQMAFIIGSTKGLWIALGAVIASQAAIALYKFISGGRTAEDTAKALNDSLAKQKSIVTELASAYSQLARATSLSSAAQKGVDAASSRGGVAAANAAARRTRLTGIDAAAVNEAASQAAIQRMMEATSEVGVLIYRNEQMRESRARQSVAEAAARRVPAGRAEELDDMRSRRAAIVRTISNNMGGRINEAFGVSPTWNRQVGSLVRELEELEATIRATENAFAEVADMMSLAAIDASQVAKLRIEAAGALLADAIASGVPGASELQNNLDALSIQMSAALSRLADAAAIEDQKIRAREVGVARADVNAASAKTADLIASSISMSIRAAFERPGAREVLGQIGDASRFAPGRVLAVSAAANLTGAQSQLGVRNAEVAAAVAEANRVRSEGRKNVVNAELAANVAAEQKELAEKNLDADDARLQAARQAWMAAEMELEAQKRAASESDKAAQANVAAAEAARNKAQADVEAAQAASKAAAAFLEASLGIGQALERTRKIAAGGLSAAEQRADLAQRQFTDRPTEENRARRDEAEKDLRKAKQDEAILQAQLDRAMMRAQENQEVARASGVIERNKNVIATIQANAAAAGGQLLPGDRDKIRDAEVAIAIAERERADAVAAATADERAAMSDFARKQQDRLEMAEAEARAPQARAEERARVRQGREDAMSKRDRGVLQAARDAENMAAAAGAIGDQAGRQAFVQQYFNNRRKELMEGGPLGQAQNERLNAIVGGPSRQELLASDAASMDGQRELNRLLRGDDPSRDANFAEMKQQTDLLQQIADGIKQATGVVVDFR